MTASTQTKPPRQVNVYEYDTNSTFRVHWLDDTGTHRRSKECGSLEEARIRANNHPEWPYAITREGSFVEVVHRG